MARRRSVSKIGASIAPSVKDFLVDNANLIKNDSKITIDESMLDLAHAISYGICKSLSSPQMEAAFHAGVCSPAGGPVGSLIFNQMKISATE